MGGLAKAIGHDTKSRILKALGELKQACPKEIEEATAIPRSTVNDHLRQLLQLGLIECAEERVTRGAVHRFYRPAKGALFVEDPEVAEFDPRKRDLLCIRALQETIADASSALSTRRQKHLAGELFSSARALTDLEGWEELVAIHRRTVEEMESVRQASWERLQKQASAPIRSSSGVFLFERLDQD